MTNDINIYNILKGKIGDSEAKELIQFIDDRSAHGKEELATKIFVAKEIADAKTEIVKWVVGIFIALALMIIGLYIKK